MEVLKKLKSTKQYSMESIQCSWTGPVPSSGSDPTQSRANLNIKKMPSQARCEGYRHCFATSPR